MTNIVTIVFAARVSETKISTDVVCFEGLLNLAKSVAVQSTVCRKLGHCKKWKDEPSQTNQKEPNPFFHGAISIAEL